MPDQKFSYTIKCNRGEYIIAKVFCQLSNIAFETDTSLDYLGIYILKLNSVQAYTTVNTYLKENYEDEE